MSDESEIPKAAELSTIWSAFAELCAQLEDNQANLNKVFKMTETVLKDGDFDGDFDVCALNATETEKTLVAENSELKIENQKLKAQNQLLNTTINEYIEGLTTITSTIRSKSDDLHQYIVNQTKHYNDIIVNERQKYASLQEKHDETLQKVRNLSSLLRTALNDS
ncbi:hypothetical protein CANCADRAFT_37 [Tortispora caseinolytica NRRL Y-17796]|uniref:Uncharacterized protein n=1 Tax=Tortispora caseinolytica NRRL Y-17796 TaxID=767744 RepID=A0A1E4TIC6_9ASCO|nr:hypothetical protein CANCADRAFT_37 [Tortispora caseinolytica NRRL Y-17796]